MAAEVSEGVAGSPTPMALRDRPWHVFSGRLHACLDELADTEPWSMTPSETAETIVELRRAQAKLAAAEARLLAHAERLDLAQHHHATSTEAWFRGELRVTARDAKRTVAFAKALETGAYPTTVEALGAGELHAEQARVIVASIDALPDWVDADVRLLGEAHMVELGRRHDAKELRALGRHLLEVVDPEGAEQELAARLEAEEAEAARATSFTLVDDGHGKAHGRFTLSSLHGRMLRTLLEGFANPAISDAIPRTEGSVDGGRRRLTREVLGDALVRLIETYPVGKVPTSGGLNATVVVTMQVDALREGLAHATVAGTDVILSASAARRMACAAGVIPAVLDGVGRVLDLGRRSRLASRAQRLAKLLEQDGLCAIEGCDRPASWADAHHWKKRWVDGGRTDLDDLIMICPRHHTLAHLPGRTVSQVEGGRYRIRRQT